MKKVVLEALLVAAAGGFLALMANALSPRGITLSRVYFPPAQPLQAASTNATPGSNALASPQNPGALSNNTALVGSTNAGLEQVLARLRAEGIGTVGSNRVVELFRDPRFAQGLVAFFDARNDAHYTSGHVPGAWQFDYYRVEPYLANALQVCQIAQEIVIYCNGGNCDDSVLTASFLRNAGVPPQKLFVYTGGFTEWATNGLPVELGQRNSGQLRTATNPPPAKAS